MYGCISVVIIFAIISHQCGGSGTVIAVAFLISLTVPERYLTVVLPGNMLLGSHFSPVA